MNNLLLFLWFELTTKFRKLGLIQARPILIKEDVDLRVRRKRRS